MRLLNTGITTLPRDNLTPGPSPRLAVERGANQLLTKFEWLVAIENDAIGKLNHGLAP